MTKDDKAQFEKDVKEQEEYRRKQGWVGDVGALARREVESRYKRR